MTDNVISNAFPANEEFMHQTELRSYHFLFVCKATTSLGYHFTPSLVSLFLFFVIQTDNSDTPVVTNTIFEKHISMFIRFAY